MTAAPHSPLVERVGKAILNTMFWEYGVLKINPDKAAQAALAACHSGELVQALRNLLDDTQHREHVCGHSPENCPVLAARALLDKVDGAS